MSLTNVQSFTFDDGEDQYKLDISGKLDASLKGADEGLAELDENGKVPDSQLPDYSPPMIILSYGTSTWSDFIDAYSSNNVVYCRASSNANPASGSQTRMAFMAYVNNAANPTNVEFQYYRSANSHSASQMSDQVFVYKLDKTSGWSVTTREAGIKQVVAGTNIGVSYSSNVVTVNNTATAEDINMGASDNTKISDALYEKADATDTVLNTTLSRGRNASSTIGANSFAFGENLIASGVDSHAEGWNTTASDSQSHAEGYQTTASGSQSHAEGNGTIASGYYSHAEGLGGSYTLNNTTYESKAAGAADHAEGYQCLTSASGQGGKHAEGYQTRATGGASHAEGSNAVASGSQSHAEGYGTKASGSQSHAEGNETTASGIQSHAEGNGTIASGQLSHAEGYFTTASGVYSHSEGLGTIAAGVSSHVSGMHNVQDNYNNWPTWTANTSYEVGDKVKRTVSGITSGYICKTANSDSSFTISNWTDQANKMNFAEIVGNGIDASNKSNARALDWDGNEFLAGDLYIHAGTGSTGGTKVATISDIPDISSKADIVSNAISGNFAALDSNGNLTDSGSKASDFLTSHQDITGKADIVSNATSGNFAALDGNGNLTDSGHSHSDYLTSHQDITGKADKVSGATNGNFAALDSNGNLTDSGSKASDFITDISGKTDKVNNATSGNFAALDSNGNLTDSGNKAADFLTSHQDITGKADKVSNATSGNFASLDSNGNLTDSGSKASDFLTSHQDITGKADKVSNAVNGNFASLDSSGNLIDSGSKASDFLTSHQDVTGKADKVSNATNGNFASLDSNGNLVDSGHKHDDYLTSHQDISGKLDASEKGTANGVAELDANGKVPSSQLPSYVDDVLEYSSVSAFPATGESGIIYVDTTANTTYRWSGSAYVAIGSSLALGETSDTAYRGDRGASAYAHAVTNKGSAFSSGLYKITTNSEGHVTAATAVQKSDITGLGIPSSDTNTHRQIQVNGTQALGDNTTVLNLKNGTNVTITNSGGEVTIAATDTTYESKEAASGGTDVSLVTTGEKYTWNNKTSNTGTVTKVSTGAGLIGGDITTTGTVKANLTSETKLSNAAADGTETSGRVYPVRLDKNGKLAVNVPWSDNDTKNTAGSTDSSSKLYLIGATTQAANPQTYSQDTAYVGVNGKLYSGGNRVLESTGDTMTGKLTLLQGCNQLAIGSGTAGQAGSASAAYIPTLWTFDLGMSPGPGDMLTVRIPIDGVSSGVWMSVDNGVTYYPVAVAAKARFTTHFGVGEIIELVFETGMTTTMYGTDETGAAAGSTTSDEVMNRWCVVNFYDTNTTYSNVKLGHGYATCTTAAATIAKVASLSSYKLNTGGYVSVKFSNDVPAGATLNINSQGAKAIYYKGAAITDGVIKAGDTAMFVYSSRYHLVSVDSVAVFNYNQETEALTISL